VVEVFGLRNPFGREEIGGKMEKGSVSSHTWDVVALLGAYDEVLQRDGKGEVVNVLREWRKWVLGFVYGDGEGSEEGMECEFGCEWDEENGRAVMVDEKGLRRVGRDEYMSEDGGRRRKLREIAEREKGVEGLDWLWEGVCRSWLDE
jgi:hypothetical protein